MKFKSAFAILALLIGSILTAEESTRPITPYKIGIILPLTGEASAFSGYAQNGLSLALADLSPEHRQSIQVIIEDDAMQPLKTITAFNNLISKHAINALIAFSSGSALSVVDLTEKYQIPLLAIASDPAVSNNRKYAFNFWVPPAIEVDVLIKVMLSKKVKKIAVASLQHPGANALIDELIPAAKRVGIEIAYAQRFPGTVEDFRSDLLKIRQIENLDGLLPIFFPGQLAIFTKQARTAGLDTQFYGFETFEDPNEVKNSQQALVNGIYSTFGDGNLLFIKNYQNKFPQQSMYSATNIYDAIQLLAKASSINRDPQAVSDYFRNLKNYNGALGTYSYIGNGWFNFPAGLKIVTPQGFENYQY